MGARVYGFRFRVQGLGFTRPAGCCSLARRPAFSDVKSAVFAPDAEAVKFVPRLDASLPRGGSLEATPLRRGCGRPRREDSDSPQGRRQPTGGARRGQDTTGLSGKRSSRPLAIHSRQRRASISRAEASEGPLLPPQAASSNHQRRRSAHSKLQLACVRHKAASNRRGRSHERRCRGRVMASQSSRPLPLHGELRLRGRARCNRLGSTESRARRAERGERGRV